MVGDGGGVNVAQLRLLFFFGFLVPQSHSSFQPLIIFFFAFSEMILTTDPPLSLSVVTWSHTAVI